MFTVVTYGAEYFPSVRVPWFEHPKCKEACHCYLFGQKLKSEVSTPLPVISCPVRVISIGSSLFLFKILFEKNAFKNYNLCAVIFEKVVWKESNSFLTLFRQAS
jgi:hypothetical protein